MQNSVGLGASVMCTHLVSHEFSPPVNVKSGQILVVHYYADGSATAEAVNEGDVADEK